jgi:hypothetical protein
MYSVIRGRQTEASAIHISIHNNAVYNDLRCLFHVVERTCNPLTVTPKVASPAKRLMNTR